MLNPLPIPTLPDFRWPSSFNPGSLPCGVASESGEGSRYCSLLDSSGKGKEFSHLSVLPEEVIHFLAPSERRVIIDGTVGGGGHSEALLKRGASVKGIDRDPDARAYASSRLAEYGERFELVAGRFGDLADIVSENQWGLVDGILLDIGVSSWQLDSAQRGFSFQSEGPLDMRMEQEGRTAADWVNEEEESELVRIFRSYGEERQSKRIAAWIIATRDDQPFETTKQLADGIESLLGRRGKRHPATRVFQALRIAVNDELGELERALESAAGVLKPGGRFAVITFQSLEDRMVKQFFKATSREEIDRPEWPAPRANPDRQYRLVTRRGVSAGESELKENARSRSARLRVVEKI